MQQIGKRMVAIVGKAMGNAADVDEKVGLEHDDGGLMSGVYIDEVELMADLNDVKKVVLVGL